MRAPDLRKAVREALARDGLCIADLGRAMVAEGFYSHDTAIYHWLSGDQDLGYDKLTWIIEWLGINLTVKYRRKRKRA